MLEQQSKTVKLSWFNIIFKSLKSCAIFWKSPKIGFWLVITLPCLILFIA